MLTERPYWPYPRIVAHRGGGLLAPENTLAALRYARNLGFEAVEFDVKLTGDDVPVLLHDDTVDRTTDGSGAVTDMLFDVVTQFDAGSWFANEFAGESVPAFAAASALCKETGLWANIEIKPSSGEEQKTGRIVARMAKLLWSGAALPPVLSSFSPEALNAARSQAPELPRALLYKEIPDNWETSLDQLDCVAMHVAHDQLDAKLVAAIQATRRGVLAYTVNDPIEAVELIEMGVDALVTDQIDVIGPHFA